MPDYQRDWRSVSEELAAMRLFVSRIEECSHELWGSMPPMAIKAMITAALMDLRDSPTGERKRSGESTTETV